MQTDLWTNVKHVIYFFMDFLPPPPSKYIVMHVIVKMGTILFLGTPHMDHIVYARSQLSEIELQIM